jgi:PST family polysaccharide transporter
MWPLRRSDGATTPATAQHRHDDEDGPDVSSAVPPPPSGPPESPVHHDRGFRHLLTQLFTLVSGRGSAGVLSALWLVIAARNLTPTEFGDLAIVLAAGAIGGVFGDLGQQTALAHEIARCGVLDRGLILAVIRRRLVMSIGAVVLIAVLYLSASSDSSLLVPLIFAGSTFGTAIYSSEISAMTAVGRAQYDGANELFSRLAVLLVGWWWLRHGGGLVAAVLIYALADVASALTITLMMRPQFRTSVHKIDLGQLKIRRTAKFALALTAAVIYARVDTWLLGQLKGSVVAGHYAAADKVLDAVLLVPAALGALSIAQVSPLPPWERWRRSKVLVGLAVLLSTVPAIVVGFFAPQVMAGLFGPSFRATSVVLVILLLSVPPGAVASACSPITAVLAGWRFTAAVGVGLAVNIGLNLPLISAYGAPGAAFANLGSEALLAVLIIVLLRHHARHTPDTGATPASGANAPDPPPSA